MGGGGRRGTEAPGWGGLARRVSLYPSPSAWQGHMSIAQWPPGAQVLGREDGRQGKAGAEHEVHFEAVFPCEQ